MLPRHQQEDAVAGQQHHPSSSSSATAHALPTEHMRAPKRSHSPARQDDARCVNSKATPAPFRPPAPPPTRRPGHLSSKSASAVPTLSTLSIVAPTTAPTPPLSPTRYVKPPSPPPRGCLRSGGGATCRGETWTEALRLCRESTRVKSALSAAVVGFTGPLQHHFLSAYRDLCYRTVCLLY